MKHNTNYISVVIVMAMTSFSLQVLSQGLKCPIVSTDVSTFEWYHQPYDATFVDTTCQWSQGYDHFYTDHYHFVIHQGYLYNVYPTYIDFLEVEGALIEKIEISTGVKVWQQTFDLRNNDAQEVVAYLHINQNNELEIGAYRRVGIPGNGPFYFGFTRSEVDQCVLSTRKYDLSTGDLMAYHFPSPTDANVKTIAKRTMIGNIVQYNNDSTFLSLSETREKLQLETINKKTGHVLEKNIISKLFHQPYDTTKYGAAIRSKILFLGSDTLVRLHMIYSNGDSIDNQASIRIYDGKANLKRELGIQKYLTKKFRDVFLHSVDERYIVLNIVRNFTFRDTNFTEYMIFDWNGNLIHDAKIVKDSDVYAFVQLQALPEYGEFLLLGKPSSSLALDFLHLSKTSTLTTKKRIHFTEDRLVTPSKFLFIDDKNLVVSMNSGFMEGGSFSRECLYITTKINSELFSSSSELVNDHNVISYPNPSSGPLTLDIRGITGKADIRIYDMVGRNVYVQEGITEGETSLDLSGLSVGTYTYKIYQGSKEMGSGQWVRM